MNNTIQVIFILSIIALLSLLKATIFNPNIIEGIANLLTIIN